MATLGLDIGGANLKAATTAGQAAAMVFPLWKSPEKLPDALRMLHNQFPACDRIAVTMTGELADCFATKSEGVASILDAVSLSAASMPISVWSTSGEFLTTHTARSQWPLVAAANWHALATWAGRFAPDGFALLFDIGSTTTDLIPLKKGTPCPCGLTDGDRLRHGELLYTGVRRTPLCAVTARVNWRGQPCRMAAELFATMQDVHLITGRIPPDPTDNGTADGRPATIKNSCDRLARMVCCDRTEISHDELKSLAEQFVNAQVHEIRTAIASLSSRIGALRLNAIILSGSGTFLATEILNGIEQCDSAVRIPLAEMFSPEIAESACAYAVACLDEENQADSAPSESGS